MNMSLHFLQKFSIYHAYISIHESKFNISKGPYTNYTQTGFWRFLTPSLQTSVYIWRTPPPRLRRQSPKLFCLILIKCRYLIQKIRIALRSKHEIGNLDQLIAGKFEYIKPKFVYVDKRRYLANSPSPSPVYGKPHVCLAFNQKCQRPRDPERLCAFFSYSYPTHRFFKQE